MRKIIKENLRPRWELEYSWATAFEELDRAFLWVDENQQNEKRTLKNERVGDGWQYRGKHNESSRKKIFEERDKTLNKHEKLRVIVGSC